MEDWKRTLQTIRRINANLALATAQPGPPSAGASLRAIAMVEARLRRRLPPSYRSFLHDQDGWSRFFHGASLWGTAELTSPRLSELARFALSSCESLVAPVVAGARRGDKVTQVIPFGLDPDGASLFAFDPTATRDDEEMPVMVWINGIGERCGDFPEFLSLVNEMLASELSDQPLALCRIA